MMASNLIITRLLLGSTHWFCECPATHAGIGAPLIQIKQWGSPMEPGLFPKKQQIGKAGLRLD